MSLNQNLKSMAINVATIALAVAIGMPLGNFLMNQFKSSAPPPGPTALAAETANLVFKGAATDFVLFATTTCQYCKAGTQLLDKSGANYKVYYIDKDAQAAKTYESMNIKGVPTLFSKQQYINGFSEAGWLRLVSKADGKSSAVVTKAP
jgi:glutaredoxin